MAATMKCRDCGGIVSKRAKLCPHCGAPVKQQTSAAVGCLSLIIIVGVVWWLVSIFNDDHTPAESSQPPPLRQQPATRTVVGSSGPPSTPGTATTATRAVTRPVVAVGDALKPATRRTPEQSVEPNWDEVDVWKPSSFYARFVVKTDATTPEQFRHVVDFYRYKLKTMDTFSIDFLASSAPKLPLLNQLLNDGPDKASDYEAYEDWVVARYSCNRTSGLDELEVHREVPRIIPIKTFRAIELYRRELGLSPPSYTALVRVPDVKPETLRQVADYYERLLKKPDYLRIYYVTTQKKWRQYPRVAPARMPKEIEMVYERSTPEPARLVRGTEFE